MPLCWQCFSFCAPGQMFWDFNTNVFTPSSLVNFLLWFQNNACLFELLLQCDEEYKTKMRIANIWVRPSLSWSYGSWRDSCLTPIQLSWIFIVVDMSPHSDTLFRFRANQSLLCLLNAACLVEKQQIPIL
jgi:hypothetical protein